MISNFKHKFRVCLYDTHTTVFDIECKDDPDWKDNKYGNGKTKCTDIVLGDCDPADEYSIEATKFCPLACGVCTSKCITK